MSSRLGVVLERTTELQKFYDSGGFTDEQASLLWDGESPSRWADLYYPLVHGDDEFGYISREEILFHYDSKETFDRDYSSNRYYYFK
ncbi:MAG: hypothetical protein QM597_04520 [Aeromicrobium sp.]|uniref:hypothetical protein n=1 Tax=Aeromicrobium sp. TaxID=1871063 RepID=UPI0039E5B22E